MNYKYNYKNYISIFRLISQNTFFTSFKDVYKRQVMGKLLDKLKADQIMRNFCFLLADKERLAFLREIANWYGCLLYTS